MTGFNAIDFDDLAGAPKMDADDRWPEPELIQRFHSNYEYPILNYHAQTRHYEQVMRHAFRGLRLEVLDHELRQLTFYPPTDEVDKTTGRRLSVKKTFPRMFLKLEMDAWIKEPDPMVTAWERFKLWLTRKPLPKAAEPDRIIVYYSMSQFQTEIFRRLWTNDFA
jgi:hypothetical protein